MNRIVVCLIIILIALFTGLGFWQLHRAERKQIILDNQKQQLALPATEINPDMQQLEDIQYRKVVIQGKYDCQHQVLLDNKHYRHKPGFHVITALFGNNGKTSILVNRGWVMMQSNRQPDAVYRRCPSDTVSVEGIATTYPALGYHFESLTDEKKDQWPKIVLELDADTLTNALGYPVTDYLVLSAPDNKDGFIRDWQFKPVISTHQHIAYAVQWFAMALTLLIISLWKYRVRHDKQIKK